LIDLNSLGIKLTKEW